MTDLKRQIANLSTRLSGGRVQMPTPGETVERWANGDARDRVIFLEESIAKLASEIDPERCRVDPGWGLSHIEGQRQLLQLRASLDKEVREREAASVAQAKREARLKYEQEQAAAREAAIVNHDAELQAQIDRFYETGGASPAPTRTPSK